MSDVTRILSEIELGNPSASGTRLLPLVYEDFRRLAAARLLTKSRDKHCKPRPWFMRRTCD